MYISKNTDILLCMRLSALYWLRHCRERMVIGFITTYAISAYHH